MYLYQKRCCYNKIPSRPKHGEDVSARAVWPFKMFKYLIGYNQVKSFIQNLRTYIESWVLRRSIRLEIERFPPVCPSRDFKDIKLGGLKRTKELKTSFIHYNPDPMGCFETGSAQYLFCCVPEIAVGKSSIGADRVGHISRLMPA
jgi:hypothetical protein